MLYILHNHADTYNSARASLSDCLHRTRRRANPLNFSGSNEDASRRRARSCRGSSTNHVDKDSSKTWSDLDNRSSRAGPEFNTFGSCIDSESARSARVLRDAELPFMVMTHAPFRFLPSVGIGAAGVGTLGNSRRYPVFTSWPRRRASTPAASASNSAPRSIPLKGILTRCRVEAMVLRNHRGEIEAEVRSHRLVRERALDLDHVRRASLLAVLLDASAVGVPSVLGPREGVHRSRDLHTRIRRLVEQEALLARDVGAAERRALLRRVLDRGHDEELVEFQRLSSSHRSDESRDRSARSSTSLDAIDHVRMIAKLVPDLLAQDQLVRAEPSEKLDGGLPGRHVDKRSGVRVVLPLLEVTGAVPASEVRGPHSHGQERRRKRLLAPNPLQLSHELDCVPVAVERHVLITANLVRNRLLAGPDIAEERVGRDSVPELLGRRAWTALDERVTEPVVLRELVEHVGLFVRGNVRSRTVGDEVRHGLSHEQRHACERSIDMDVAGSRKHLVSPAELLSCCEGEKVGSPKSRDHAPMVATPGQSSYVETVALTSVSASQREPSHTRMARS